LINLAERPYRTVRAGVSYYTDEGLGGQASWENRNLTGKAESLSITVFASEIKYGARSSLTKPDIFDRDTDLHIDLEASRETTDAYDSQKASLGALLERRIGRQVTLTGGCAYELVRVTQQEEGNSHGLLSVPLSAELDRRNDKLDPVRGGALLLSTTPYKDVFSNLAFLKSQAEGSVFVRLSRSTQTVLALRGMVGSITGSASENVPADKRFYAGGGGSIRGYKYQSVGELEDGVPVGGNSMAAVSTELRTRLSPSIGAAVFIDGGTAYSGSSPDSGTPFLWGAGAGLRYYLGSMPFRLDVAVPMDRRKDVDSAYQFYVSLGQSF